MRTIRLIHVVNGALLLLLFGGSVWVYPTLPDQIPRHFGIGEVAYWDTTLLHWLSLPLIAAPCMMLFYGLAGMMGATQALKAFSVSNRTEYEQLSSGQKQAIARVLRGGLYGMATLVLIVFGAGQIGIYAVATTPATTLPPLVRWASGTALFALLVLPLGLTWWRGRRIRNGFDRDR